MRNAAMLRRKCAETVVDDRQTDGGNPETEVAFCVSGKLVDVLAEIIVIGE